MKKITILLALLFGFAGPSELNATPYVASSKAPAPQIHPVNILDYYSLLPEKLLSINSLGGFKYSLKKAKGGWITHSLAGYGLQPVVDIKNGYIQIDDEGTGGGSVTETVVLFRKADKEALIGVGIEEFDGFHMDYGLAFYEFRNNHWKDVTNKALPTLTFKEFLQEKYVKLTLDKTSRIFRMLSWRYQLPRYGTSITVSINHSQIQFLLDNEVDKKTGKPLDQKNKELLSELVQNLGYESFLLNWNRREGRFEPGEKKVMDYKTIAGYFENMKDDVSFRKESKAQLEKKILTKVLELPEVRERAKEIDSLSHHTRKLKVMIAGEPTEEEPYYYVKAVEDNGGNFVTHLHFYVDPKNMEIKVYDVVEDLTFTLEEWRKRELKRR